MFSLVNNLYKTHSILNTKNMTDMYSVLYTIAFEPLCVLVNYFHKPLIQKAVAFGTACFETLMA